jgi:hypothetical protein
MSRTLPSPPPRSRSIAPSERSRNSFLLHLRILLLLALLLQDLPPRAENLAAGKKLFIHEIAPARSGECGRELIEMKAALVWHDALRDFETGTRAPLGGLHDAAGWETPG